MSKPKSTITISLNEQDQVEILVAHDPPPTGERKDWHPPAKIADHLVRRVVDMFKQHGSEPVVEATINTSTGHIDVTTRKDKEEGE